MQKILLVEDEPQIAEPIAQYLSKSGFAVEVESDGKVAFQKIKSHHTGLALVVLDIVLPHMNGFTICSELRAAKIQLPILILTNLGDTENVVKGLELGADDYLDKPFMLAELGARIKSLLRRPEVFVSKEIRLGQLYINRDSREAIFGGRNILLRRKEFDLLYYLALNHGQTISRDKILLNVWGREGDPNPSTVDVHIRLLRKKLGDLDKQVLQTIYGFGYKLALKEK